MVTATVWNCKISEYRQPLFREWQVMKRIIQANIDRFKQLLETTTDPTKRRTLQCLLAAEEEKMASLEAASSRDKKSN